MSEEERKSTEETESRQETPAEENAAGKEKTGTDEESAAPEEGQALAILEGLLLIVGDDGLTAAQAAQALDITPERAENLFARLVQQYQDPGHGFEVADYGGTYRFVSKTLVHPYARKLFQMGKAATLSSAALETLSIIAYKGPITRVEIEEIRGVGADMMLRKLLARGLIQESGRSEAPGRPILYEVTPEFMNSFGLLSLKELPDLPEFGKEDEDEEEGDFLRE
jgi:segregation and condensation protein B